jgi:predicted acyltransferase
VQPVVASFDSQRQRLRSLDVFRGATVALMILVNNPGSWQHLYPPLAHAAWHGWTLTDLVFPFFLFAVGNALALTSAPLPGAPPVSFWPRWLRRTLLIGALGLLLNAAPFLRWSESGDLVLRSWDNLRLMGVLQRIALAWSCAALIVHLGGVRAAWVTSLLLLLGYWAACVAWGRGADPYSLEGFFGTALDRQLLGVTHLYQGEGVPFDPEGLASTLPAIAQVLLGYLAGRALAGLAASAPGAPPPPRWRLFAPLGPAGRLALWAMLALLLAWCWQPLMPINKKLWTSSYVLLTTGWALFTLLLIVWAVDRRGWQGPLVRLFEAFGQNALFIFVLSGLVPRVWGLLKGPPSVAGPLPAGPLPGMPPPGWRVLAEPLIADPRAASLLVALLHVAAYAALAWWLARRRLFIRV